MEIKHKGFKEKLSECQRKGGNQECFCKLENVKTYNYNNLITTMGLNLGRK